jgi:hypothetical protein
MLKPKKLWNRPALWSPARKNQQHCEKPEFYGTRLAFAPSLDVAGLLNRKHSPAVLEQHRAVQDAGTYITKQGRTRSACMASGDGSPNAGSEARRSDHVCEDRDDAGTQSPRRAGV